MAALIIGGDTAALICKIIYKNIVPVVIYTSTVMVLLGLIAMYVCKIQGLSVKSVGDKNKDTKDNTEK